MSWAAWWSPSLISSVRGYLSIVLYLKSRDYGDVSAERQQWHLTM